MHETVILYLARLADPHSSAKDHQKHIDELWVQQMEDLEYLDDCLIVNCCQSIVIWIIVPD